MQLPIVKVVGEGFGKPLASELDQLRLHLFRSRLLLPLAVLFVNVDGV
jgi:hypothetical protein